MKLKKTFVLLFVVVFTLSMLAACGSKDKKADGGATTENPIVIQLAHVEPEDRSLHQGAVQFKEYVEKESGGRIQVNILPNGEFGGDREAVEGVANGTIQMAAAVTSVLTSYGDDFMVLDLPFLFNSREASYEALDGELGEKLDAALPDGLTGLGYNDNGLRQITNNVRPINEPADLSGVKMRIMESPVYQTMFKLLGANPSPMSFTEVYTALQQGTVDGQENGAALIYASNFQDVQKYLSLTGHVYSVNAIVINTDFYESLPEDLQKIIADGVKVGLVDGQREIEGNSDADFIKLLADAGMTVNEVSDENRQKFKDTLAPMYDEYKEKIAPEIFEIVDKYNNDFS